MRESTKFKIEEGKLILRKSPKENGTLRVEFEHAPDANSENVMTCDMKAAQKEYFLPQNFPELGKVIKVEMIYE